jgi:sigma-B regulation protein RsbU (phosphoserine phosphatase)
MKILNDVSTGGPGEKEKPYNSESTLMGSEYCPRILVIDDDPVIRNVMVTFLTKKGYEILAAPDGREGIRLFRKEQPDLVLCDMRMPNTDGLEVLKVVKQEAPQTPIVMISGAGLIEDVVKALRLGAWDYLIKPFPNLAVLGHAVSNSLHRAKLERENRRYREQLELTNRELQAGLDILHADQEAGRHVQSQLLPNPEGRFGNYTFSYIFIPSLFLSGDFLDYFKIDDKHIGFYIADVSGHGSSSAFVTVLLKNVISQALRRYQARGDTMIIHPSKMFSYLNSEILHTRLGKYLTMFYGILDTDTDTLHYSIGGHYPRPVLTTGQQTGFVSGEGLPIGMFDFAEYAEETVVVPEQFTFAMFSDGTLDMINADSLEDKERFLLDMCCRSEASIRSVREHLKLDRISKAHDDITVFLIQRRA